MNSVRLFNHTLITVLSIIIFSTSYTFSNAQCINKQFSTATLSSIDFGQSFTMPPTGCGSQFVSFVFERKDGFSNNLDAETATLEIFLGETVTGTALYTQTGIPITAGVGNKTLVLGGGTGSLSFTNGVQYTVYVTVSGSTDWQLGQGSSGDTYDGGRGYMLSSFQNGFNMDFIINTNAPLPVELVSFEASQRETVVELDWHTASEEFNEGFEVERSMDGRTWETLGFVEGNGTTSEVSYYTYIDEKPLSASNYYRLKQLDYDGMFEYSETVNVQFEATSKQVGELYPNPSKTGKVNLDFTSNMEEDLSISVFDVNGKLVYNEAQFIMEGYNNLEMDLSILETGVYMVQMNGKNSTTNRKLIIN